MLEITKLYESLLVPQLQNDRLHCSYAYLADAILAAVLWLPASMSRRLMLIYRTVPFNRRPVLSMACAIWCLGISPPFVAGAGPCCQVEPSAGHPCSKVPGRVLMPRVCPLSALASLSTGRLASLSATSLILYRLCFIYKLQFRTSEFIRCFLSLQLSRVRCCQPGGLLSRAQPVLVARRPRGSYNTAHQAAARTTKVLHHRLARTHRQRRHPRQAAAGAAGIGFSPKPA